MTTGSRSANATGNAGAGAVYGLGLFGAVVFYWQQADGFWGHIWALIEALLWPAFVVYDLLQHLNG